MEEAITRVSILGHENTTDRLTHKTYTLYRTMVIYANEPHERLIRFRQFYWFYSKLPSKDKKAVKALFPQRHFSKSTSMKPSTLHKRHAKLNEFFTAMLKQENSTKTKDLLCELFKVGKYKCDTLMIHPPAFNPLQGQPSTSRGMPSSEAPRPAIKTRQVEEIVSTTSKVESKGAESDNIPRFEEIQETVQSTEFKRFETLNSTSTVQDQGEAILSTDEVVSKAKEKLKDVSKGTNGQATSTPNHLVATAEDELTGLASTLGGTATSLKVEAKAASTTDRTKPASILNHPVSKVGEQLKGFTEQTSNATSCEMKKTEEVVVLEKDDSIHSEEYYRQLVATQSNRIQQLIEGQGHGNDKENTLLPPELNSSLKNQQLESMNSEKHSDETPDYMEVVAKQQERITSLLQTRTATVPPTA